MTLEHEIESEAYAMDLDAWIGGIGESAYVIHFEHLEDIMHAEHQFQVRLVVHDVCIFGESIQFRIVGIGFQEGVVLAGEMSPHAFERHIFAPFQSFEQRYAVEDFSREVPCNIELCVAVVQELHVLHHVECTLGFEE